MTWVYVLIYLLGVLPTARYIHHHKDIISGWAVLFSVVWPLIIAFNAINWYVTKPTKAQIAAKKQKEAERVAKEFELTLFDGKTTEQRELEQRVKSLEKINKTLDRDLNHEREKFHRYMSRGGRYG